MEKEDIEIIELKKKFIIEKVKLFNKFERIEILKIIKKYKICYSENNNGIFINLNILNNTIIDEIEKFVNYCIIKKNHLQNEKTKRDNFESLLKINTTNINNNPNKNNIKHGKEKTFIFNEELDTDQNDMYYKDSPFKLPKINI